MFLFFKQTTSYEMRISDWSSDVCSSDLDHALDRGAHGWTAPLHPGRSWLSGHIGIRNHGIARLTIASSYDVRAASVCAACLICPLRGAIFLRPAPARPPGRVRPCPLDRPFEPTRRQARAGAPLRTKGDRKKD